ncbi:hypothetical protein KIN20_001984, partial [Parelaphostrongylus tenuis]
MFTYELLLTHEGDFSQVELCVSVGHVLFAGTRTYTVTGFTTLPVGMVYADMPDVSCQLPGIATRKGEAQAFVELLVMQRVFDVLQNQARNALLPEPVISAILDQLTVNVTYGPMQCQRVVLDLNMDI